MERFEPKLNRHIEVRTLPRYDKDQKIVGLVHIVVDISERKKVEEANKNLQAQLFQAQKMESVGSPAASPTTSTIFSAPSSGTARSFAKGRMTTTRYRSTRMSSSIPERRRRR